MTISITITVLDFHSKQFLTVDLSLCYMSVLTLRDTLKTCRSFLPSMFCTQTVLWTVTWNSCLMEKLSKTLSSFCSKRKEGICSLVSLVSFSSKLAAKTLQNAFSIPHKICSQSAHFFLETTWREKLEEASKERCLFRISCLRFFIPFSPAKYLLLSCSLFSWSLALRSTSFEMTRRGARKHKNRASSSLRETEIKEIVSCLPVARTRFLVLSVCSLIPFFSSSSSSLDSHTPIRLLQSTKR